MLSKWFFNTNDMGMVARISGDFPCPAKIERFEPILTTFFGPCPDIISRCFGTVNPYSLAHFVGSINREGKRSVKRGGTY